jgi:hypothetical protein
VLVTRSLDTSGQAPGTRQLAEGLGPTRARLVCPGHPRYHASIDARCFGPGERIVFLPYTEQMYERAQRWMQERGLFDERGSIPAYAGPIVAEVIPGDPDRAMGVDGDRRLKTRRRRRPASRASSTSPAPCSWKALEPAIWSLDAFQARELAFELLMLAEVAEQWEQAR